MSEYFAERPQNRGLPAHVYDQVAQIERERDAAIKDARSLDWLQEMVVEVRIPMRYGSNLLFRVAPDAESDFPNNGLRQRIEENVGENS